MKGFEMIMEERIRILKDFEKNKDKYLDNIKRVAMKYNGIAKLFGSFLEKDKFFGGSDVDVLVFIPGIQKNKKLKWKVIRELKESVNNNPRFEFHVVDEGMYRMYLKLVKKFKEL